MWRARPVRSRVWRGKLMRAKLITSTQGINSGADGTYFGSQCAIRKSKLIRVTNMSVSRRISCTLGGGSAMARPTMPIRGGAVFLVWLNMSCGLKRHSSSTTYVKKCMSFYAISDCVKLSREVVHQRSHTERCVLRNQVNVAWSKYFLSLCICKSIIYHRIYSKYI